MRRFAVIALALALGSLAGLAPTLAGAQYGQAPPAITADNNVFSPMQATVAAGSQVSFANTAVSFGHNVHFVAAPAQPACDASLPSAPTSAAWSGNCTFTTPGAYTFICDKHGHYDPATGSASGMFGTITVTGGGATSATTTSSATTTFSTMTTTSTPAAMPVALSLRVSQHGSRVHAAVIVPVSKSSIAAQLLTGRGSVVGRRSLSNAAAGRLALTVALDRRGRRALAAHHHLSLRLRVTVTAPGGQPSTATHAVTLHA